MFLLIRKGKALWTWDCSYILYKMHIVLQAIWRKHFFVPGRPGAMLSGRWGFVVSIWKREQRRFSKIEKFRACGKVILAKFTKLTFTLFLIVLKNWVENIEKYFFGPINYNRSKVAILPAMGHGSISNFFQWEKYFHIFLKRLITGWLETKPLPNLKSSKFSSFFIQQLYIQNITVSNESI